MKDLAEEEALKKVQSLARNTILETDAVYSHGFDQGYIKGVIEGQKVGREMMMRAVETQTRTHYVCCSHCKDDFLKQFPEGRVVK